MEKMREFLGTRIKKTSKGFNSKNLKKNTTKVEDLLTLKMRQVVSKERDRERKTGKESNN